MALGVREFARKPIDFGEFSKVVMRMVRDWVETGSQRGGCRVIPLGVYEISLVIVAIIFLGWATMMLVPF